MNIHKNNNIININNIHLYVKQDKCKKYTFINKNNRSYKRNNDNKKIHPNQKTPIIMIISKTITIVMKSVERMEIQRFNIIKMY